MFVHDANTHGQVHAFLSYKDTLLTTSDILVYLNLGPGTEKVTIDLISLKLITSPSTNCKFTIKSNLQLILC